MGFYRRKKGSNDYTRTMDYSISFSGHYFPEVSITSKKCHIHQCGYLLEMAPALSIYFHAFLSGIHGHGLRGSSDKQISD